MSSDPTNQFGANQYGSPSGYPFNKPRPFNSSQATSSPPSPHFQRSPSPIPAVQPSMPPVGTHASQAGGQVAATAILEANSQDLKQPTEANSRLAADLKKFDQVAENIREQLVLAPNFEQRCQQAFDLANDLFGNAPTWVCFYRELLGGNGLVHTLFDNNADFGSFLRTEQYHQIQMMLTALRSRDLPENDPNDPQRMITVRLPKSLHEAMCDEAGRLNISVNRLCISRMLQLLDPKMIPETNSKPRGRKPRNRTKEIE